MFWLRNKKIIFCNALLTKGLNMSIALSDNFYMCENGQVNKVDIKLL